MDDIPIAELVAAAAAGDEAAWDEIVSRYSPLLAGVIGGYRLSPAVRQDIAQIVWLRLVEKLDTLRDPQCLPGWLVTTARHEALRQIEQQSRVQSRDPLDAYWVDQGDVVVTLPTTETAAAGAARGSAQRPRRAARPPAAAAAAADRRPTTVVRDDREPPRHLDRQHRAHPGPRPGPTPPEQRTASLARGPLRAR